MDTKKSTFITWDEYVESQNTQSQHESGKLHNSIEVVKQELKGDIKAVKADLVEVKQELKGDIKAVKADLAEVKSDIKAVKADLAEVKQELKGDVAELRVEVWRADGRAQNRSLDNPIMPIIPLPVYRPGVGAQFPSKFPRTPRDFWKLRLPGRIVLLIDLIEFYEIPYEAWHQIDIDHRRGSHEETESEEEDAPSSSYKHLSAKTAVRKYQNIAVDALALYIGLIESKFEHFTARAARWKGNTYTGKRGHSKEEVQGQTKKARSFPKNSPPNDDARIQPDLYAPPKSKSESSASARTRIIWDHDRSNAPPGPTLMYPQRGLVLDVEIEQESGSEEYYQSPTDIMSRRSLPLRTEDVKLKGKTGG